MEIIFGFFIGVIASGFIGMCYFKKLNTQFQTRCKLCSWIHNERFRRSGWDMAIEKELEKFIKE